MEKMAWVFELYDKLSGPAERMQSAVDKMSASLERMDFKSRSSFETFNRLGAGLGGWVTTFKSIGSAIWDMAEGLGSAVLSIGKFVLQQFSFRESTLASLKLITGSEAGAHELFDTSVRLAQATPFGTKDVVGSMTRIMAAGFNKGDANVLFQAIGDVAAASNFDPTVMQSVMTQIAQIKSKGKLEMQDLKQVTGWTSAIGVGMNQVYEAIGKRTKESVAQVMARMTSGQVGSDQAILGIVEAITKKTGGKAGSLMQAQGETLAGMWSTIASIPSDIFSTMPIEKMKGFSVFSGFVRNLRDALNPTSEAGKRLQGVLEKIVGQIGMMFERFDGSKGAVALFDLISDGVDQFIGAWKFAGTMIDAFVANSKPGLVTLKDLFDKAFGKNDGMDTFKNILLFISETMGTLVTRVTEFTAGLIGLYDSIVKYGDAWDFYYGSDKGKNATSPFRQKPTPEQWDNASNAKPPTAGQTFSKEFAAAKTTHITGNTIHFQLTVDGGADPEIFAKKLGDAIPAHMSSVFERMALEAGGEE